MSDEDLPSPDVVPAEFAVAVKKRSTEELKPHTFESLRGRLVEVRASGYLYRGLLDGADEESLYLKGELRYFVLPLSSVTDVRDAQDSPSPLAGPPPGFPAEEPAPVVEGILEEPSDDEPG